MYKISILVLFFVCFISGLYLDLDVDAEASENSSFTYPRDEKSIKRFEIYRNAYSKLSEDWDCSLMNDIAKEMVREFSFSGKSRDYRKKVFLSVYPFINVAQTRGCVK